MRKAAKLAQIFVGSVGEPKPGRGTDAFKDAKKAESDDVSCRNETAKTVKVLAKNAQCLLASALLLNRWDRCRGAVSSSRKYLLWLICCRDAVLRLSSVG